MAISQFSFTNYKSFKKAALLDFTAEPIKDNAVSLIIDKSDGEKFLPVIVIYGPNGGGKSTVLEALNYLRMYVLQMVFISELDEDNQELSELLHQFKNSGIIFKDKYYRFDSNCRDLPTSFDIMFRTSENQYQYQLSILHKEIVEENLYMQVIGEDDARIIFERTGEECLLGTDIEEIAVEKVKNTMPLLAHIFINYDIYFVNDVISWLRKVHFVNYDNPRKEKKILIPKTSDEKIIMFELLQKMDINITDIRIEKDVDGKIKNIYTKHAFENGETHEIAFEEESSGTRKLFSCLAEILNCLEEGSLIIADELDAKLHPKLLRYIIELFTDPNSNKCGAQLLLTSHDVTTMTPEVYRRDEIWFCAKNSYNASKLYSLISIRKENGQPPRNDESYGKQYLEGRYGADPYIRKILDWGISDEPQT